MNKGLTTALIVGILMISFSISYYYLKVLPDIKLGSENPVTEEVSSENSITKEVSYFDQKQKCNSYLSGLEEEIDEYNNKFSQWQSKNLEEIFYSPTEDTCIAVIHSFFFEVNGSGLRGSTEKEIRDVLTGEQSIYFITGEDGLYTEESYDFDERYSYLKDEF